MTFTLREGSASCVSKVPSAYIATDDLKVAVNAATLLRRPLLVKGEPGTGKTVLAQEIAKAFGAPLIDLEHQVDHQGAAGPLRI